MNEFDESDIEFDLDELATRLYRARERNIGDVDDYDSDLCPRERGVVDAMEAVGFDFLGAGDARVVFRVPGVDDVVVKFARYGAGDRLHDGLEQNSHAVYLWTRLSEHDVGDFRLLPILDYADDRQWVAMPEVTPLAEEADEHDDVPGMVEDLRKNLLPLSDHLKVPEITDGNAAMWNGELYAFDYGLKPVDLSKYAVDGEETEDDPHNATNN